MSAQRVEREADAEAPAFDVGLDPDEFKLAFRHHAAGVAIITADPGDGPVALTATSVFSVSAEPPILVFSLSARASATPALLRASTVVVHLLGSTHLELARLCSTTGADRFAGSEWRRLETGEPHFPQVPVWLRGRVINRMDAGDSTVVAVHALEAHRHPFAESTTPLVYHNRAWHALGEASKLD